MTEKILQNNEKNNFIYTEYMPDSERLKLFSSYTLKIREKNG